MSLATEIAGKLNYLNRQDNVAANATLPYSGYTQVSKKLDNFVFQTSSSFLNKVADNNRYVKFGEKVVDTYGPELITNGDFSTSTITYIPPVSTRGTAVIENGRLKITRSGTDTGGNVYIGYSGFDASKVYELKISWDIGTALGIKIYNDSNGYMSSKSGSTVLYVTGKTILNIALDEVSKTNNYCYFDNISVREIQTAQFTVPNVTGIITNGSNTTSVAVNAGDYVVDGSDSGTQLIGHTIPIGVSGDNLLYPTQFILGEKYYFNITVSGITSGYVRVYFGLYDNANGMYVDIYSNGTITGTFKHSSQALNRDGYTFNNTGGSSVTITAISVKRVSDTFRAKQDAPIGTALTNTAYFEDRTQIGVTNQQLAYHAYNTLTNSYEGIKVETLFSDVSKEDLLDNSVWMARNGFSKVSEFLYSKGSYLCLPVGIWQSLNNGAYHPFFNMAGTRGTLYQIDITGSTYWYNDTSVSRNIFLNNMADMFKIGTTGSSTVKVRLESGRIAEGRLYRPDSKFYDICYPDQFIDVREYAKVLNPYEVDLIRADKEENGVEEVIVGFAQALTPVKKGLDSNQVFIELGVSNNFINYGDNANWRTTTMPNYNIVLIDASGVVHKDCFAGFSVNGTYLHWIEGFTTAAIVNIEGTCYIGAIKTKPILTSNTKLSTDLIGNPTNYPQIMKDRLASGVGIVGINPILISDTGVNLIPDGTSKNYKVSKKSTSDAFNYVTLSSGEVTGGGAATTINVIGNYVTASYLATDGRLFSYTSKNNPYIQTTPKPVVEVLPKVKASNSHSIYKGAMVTNAVTGKVAVGNGSNGIESKVLENAIIGNYYDVSLPTSGTVLFENGKRYLYNGGGANGMIGEVYYFIGVTASNAISVIGFDTSPNFKKSYVKGILLSHVVNHQPITLDNSNSPASKWFECLEEGNNGVLAGVYGQEVVYGADTGNFTNLSNGTTTDFSNNTVRTFHGAIPLNGKIK